MTDVNAADVAAAAGISYEDPSVAELVKAAPYGGAGLLAAAAAGLHRRVAYLEALLGTHPDPASPAAGVVQLAVNGTRGQLSVAPAAQDEPPGQV
jgi:hypothetical protein